MAGMNASNIDYICNNQNILIVHYDCYIMEDSKYLLLAKPLLNKYWLIIIMYLGGGLHGKKGLSNVIPSNMHHLPFASLHQHMLRGDLQREDDMH